MAAPTKDQAPDFVQYQLPEILPAENPIRQTPSGLVLQNGEFASPNYVPGFSGWKLDAQGNFEAVNGTFSGTLTGIALNIPDATTASSFHTDTSGNSWWGANVASGYAGANAYILATGAAVFKNVQIGGSTIQYVITNSGIFSFGDSADGTVIISVNTLLTTDMYYANLTINSGVTLNPGGYRIFVSGTLTFVGTGKIGRNAADGNLSDGYLKGSLAGGTGGAGGAAGSNGSAGGAGTSATNSLGSSGHNGGHGGDNAGIPMTGGAGGTGGTATAANVALKVGIQLAQLLDISSTGATVKYANSASGGGGGGGNGGGGGSGQTGGAGGGGGASGGIIAVYARYIVGVGGTHFSADGGNGDNGGNCGGPGTTGGVGGGGSGGNGGIIILVYNTVTNLGTVSVASGTKGVKGTVGSATNATDGVDGSAGVVYQFALSL